MKLEHITVAIALSAALFGCGGAVANGAARSTALTSAETNDMPSPRVGKAQRASADLLSDDKPAPVKDGSRKNEFADWK